MSRRLHVPPERLAAGRLRLDGEDFHYLARVLRVASGDEVTLFDGAGREAPARVRAVELDARALELDVGAPRAAAGAAHEITLLQALVKGERMDLVVQKATELGAARIVPVVAARSVVHLGGERAAGRVARWQKIAREAARQCGRADAPTVARVVTLSDALREAPADAWRILLHEAEQGMKLRDVVPTAPPRRVVVAVGPEGGFSDAEVTAAREAGFAVASLGARVLRAETAAIAALAVVGWILGEL